MKNLALMTSAALMLAASPLLAQDSGAPGATAAPATQAAPPTGDLLTTAAAAGEFKTLARAIDAAGMTEQLKGGQFVTLFAPTDAAFAALPPGTVETLLKPENQAQLKQLLSNHLVPGYATSAFLAQQSNSVMETVGGGQVAINTADGKVTVSGAHVVTADVRATNGLIHGIDKVLLPADRQASSSAAPTGAF